MSLLIYKFLIYKAVDILILGFNLEWADCLTGLNLKLFDKFFLGLAISRWAQRLDFG